MDTRVFPLGLAMPVIGVLEFRRSLSPTRVGFRMFPVQ